MSKKVVVAMSGGVDSSVAALLMLEKGYEIIGMTMKLWKDHPAGQSKSSDSVEEARNIADQLEIPFYVLDIVDEFKQKIVDQFIADYKAGLTPNPCFWCNQKIKWGLMVDKALELGADHLATGHYARLSEDQTGHFHLFKGLDPTKDQSYMLSGLSQSQLSFGLLPLGKYTKTRVKEIAKDWNFKAAENPESQDLCFIPDGDYRNFLNRYGSEIISKGEIKNISGKVIGEHKGLQNYTIGQRKGIGSGFGIPQYVIAKNIESNELVIGPVEALGSNLIRIQSVNRVSSDPIDPSIEYTVKIRYKSHPVKCKIGTESSGSLTIKLPDMVRDATPGQIAVIYNQDEVIASGIINSAERA